MQLTQAETQLQIAYKDLSTIGESWKKYDGEFLDGKQHGYGTLSLANGDQFVGQFIRGAAHGIGSYMFADHSRFFSGEWSDNKIVKEY